MVAGSYPSWSPDGSKLAFYGPRGIFPLEVVDADGRGVRTIADTAFYAWSPESKRIVFTKSVEGHLSLYVTRSDGTGRMRLTNGDDASPAWSIRNQIAFLRSFPRGPGFSQSLMVMNSDGTGQQTIAADVGGETPAWSPDGSKIAFTKEAPNGVDSNLLVANADGQDVRRVSRRPGYGLQLAWSPDGRQIAFSGLFGSDSELLFVAKADGSQLRQIHHRIGGSDAAGAFAWSPEEDALAVAAGAPNDILVIQLASGRAKRITHGFRDGSDSGDPSWDPLRRPTSALGGRAVPAGIVPDARPSSEGLTTHGSARGLAADGTRLALSLESTRRSCQHIELWDERTGGVISFHNSAGSCREIEGSAFAGARVAWRIVDPGGNSTGFSLLTATTARPRPRALAGSATDQGHSAGDHIGRPVGHRSLLLLNRWHVCQTYGRDLDDWCAGKHPRNTFRIDRASLQRFAGGRLRTLRRGLDTLRVLATDGRVAAILERDGSISLLRGDGMLVGRFKVRGQRVRAVALAGEKLLLEAGRAIHLFDRRSGAEGWTLALPRGAKLVDAEGSLAVTVAGTRVIVSALDRGAQLVIRTGGRSPVRAQIERAGLWYSFTTGKNRGRVVFVPMRRIRRELRPR